MGKLSIISDVFSMAFSVKPLNENENELIAHAKEIYEAEARGHEEGYTEGVNDVLHADQPNSEPAAVTALDQALSGNPAIEAMDNSFSE